MFTNNKQNKLRQTKKDEIREESHLNYTTAIKCALFPYLLTCLTYIKDVFVLFHLLIFSLFVKIIAPKGHGVFIKYSILAI